MRVTSLMKAPNYNYLHFKSMRVVSHDLQLLLTVKLLNVQNRMFASQLFRVLPERTLVTNLKIMKQF